MTTKEAKKTTTEAAEAKAKKPAKAKKTESAKGARSAEPQRTWYLINAENLVMGRLAVTVANILTGKNKPTYERHVDHGDHVVVINAGKVKVTGRKMTDKIYKSFSLYPGGLKEWTLERAFAKDATYPLYHAVKGMLPKNSLGFHMLKKLNLYPDANHPHAAQKPKDITGAVNA